MVGCGTSNPPVTADMAMAATVDMAMAVTPADMTPTGTAVLFEVRTTVPFNAGDAGVVMVPVKVLAPVVSLTAANAPAPDYDSNPGMLLGCKGNHYDATKPKLPTMDVNGGTVKITGFEKATTLSQSMPEEINCQIGSVGYYKCGFGPTTDAGVGPDPGVTPYPGTADLVKADQKVRFQSTGGAGFAAFDTAMAVAAADKVNVTDDLSKITLSPTQDTTIAFTCPNETSGCGLTGIVARVVFATVTPDDQTFPGAVFGDVTCVGVGASGTIKINKEAIAAALGTDKTYKSARVFLLRAKLPAQGQKVNAAAGNGQLVNRAFSVQ